MKNYKNFILIFFIISIFSCLTSPDTDSKFRQADKYRAIIKKYNLQKYDNDNFKDAEINYSDAQKYIETKKKSQADKSLIEANDKYKAVVDKGFPLCTEDKNKEVIDSKKNALDIKADVAVKAEFNDADSSLNEALKYKDQKDYENAVNSFDLSKSKFDQVYKDASFKKERVEKSIESTETVKNEIDKKSNDLEQELIKSNQ